MGSDALYITDSELFAQYSRMKARPRRGKFFAEPVLLGERDTRRGVKLPEERDSETSTQPIRAEVIEVGAPPFDDYGNETPWDFSAGDHVLVPSYAGHHYGFINHEGFPETLWIIDSREAFTVFRQEE